MLCLSREDRRLYDRNADRWWDGEDRFFRSLRSVKAFHLELLNEAFGDRLDGATVIDLGCGGGLFSLPLAEQGAGVLGIGLSHASVRAARAEAMRRSLDAHFVCGDLCRTPLPDRCADFVLLSDVLEHAPDPKAAVAEASRLLRPGGMLFVNTFDRSLASGFVVVTLAEGLGLVPRGTHDARFFVRPYELESMAARSSLRLLNIQRESVALLPTIATWTVHLRRSRAGFGYTALLQKVGA